MANSSRALVIASGLFFVGNGVLFPLAAYLIRDLPTYTSANWHFWLTASLGVGIAIPVAVLVSTGVVATFDRLRGRAETSPLSLLAFAAVWSLPGLYSNHNALADWRVGPSAVTKRVEKAEPVKVSFDSMAGSHVYWDCGLTFDDGSRRQIHRYSVSFLSSDHSDSERGDPCHGIRGGERYRVVTLRRLDELVAIEPAAAAN